MVAKEKPSGSLRGLFPFIGGDGNLQQAAEQNADNHSEEADKCREHGRQAARNAGSASPEVQTFVALTFERSANQPRALRPELLGECTPNACIGMAERRSVQGTRSLESEPAGSPRKQPNRAPGGACASPSLLPARLGLMPHQAVFHASVTVEDERALAQSPSSAERIIRAP